LSSEEVLRYAAEYQKTIPELPVRQMTGLESLIEPFVQGPVPSHLIIEWDAPDKETKGARKKH
jgi:hypothetical protein